MTQVRPSERGFLINSRSGGIAELRSSVLSVAFGPLNSVPSTAEMPGRDPGRSGRTSRMTELRGVAQVGYRLRVPLSDELTFKTT